MKIGRNAPCVCGSGKKYKKCCLSKAQYELTEDNLDLQKNDEEDGLGNLYDSLLKITIDIHRGRLDKKPHIKEYRKVRKLHSEIVNGMMKYYDEGNF